MDFDELVEEYGSEYLRENRSDDAYYDMSMIDEMFEGKSNTYVLQRAYFGGAYGWKNEHVPFDPNADYFAFDGYGNLLSIDEIDLSSYVKENIDESDFMDWYENQGYIEDDEEGDF